MGQIDKAYTELIEAYKAVDDAFTDDKKEKALQIIDTIRHHKHALAQSFDSLPFSIKNFLKKLHTYGLLKSHAPGLEQQIMLDIGDTSTWHTIRKSPAELKQIYGRTNLEELKNDHYHWFLEEEYSHIINTILPQYHRLLKILHKELHRSPEHDNPGENDSNSSIQLCNQILQHTKESNLFEEELKSDAMIIDSLKKQIRDGETDHRRTNIRRLSEIITARETKCYSYMTTYQKFKYKVRGIIQ